jgi:hypothetical protein
MLQGSLLALSRTCLQSVTLPPTPSSFWWVLTRVPLPQWMCELNVWLWVLLHVCRQPAWLNTATECTLLWACSLQQNQNWDNEPGHTVQWLFNYTHLSTPAQTLSPFKPKAQVRTPKLHGDLTSPSPTARQVAEEISLPFLISTPTIWPSGGVVEPDLLWPLEFQGLCLHYYNWHTSYYSALVKQPSLSSQTGLHKKARM